jgi:hypothetical protein
MKVTYFTKRIFGLLLIGFLVNLASVSGEGRHALISSYGTIDEGRVLDGVNMHPWDVDTPYFAGRAYFDLAQVIGVKWIRLAVTDPRDVTWSGPWFRLFVEEAHARGIKVLGIIDRYIVGENSSFELSDWQSSLDLVIKTYGNSVDAWEIWNEPNIPLFYLGYMDGTPEHYFNMLKMSYLTIKASNPEALVVFGGPSLGGTNCTEFVSRCWELGADKYCDIFALHIYEENEGPVPGRLASITDPKPIWITETGVSSLEYGLDGQSQQLKLLSAYFDNIQKGYRIQNAFWYCWMDYAKQNDTMNVFGGPVTRADFCGLLTVDLLPKSAWESYRIST